MFWEHRLSTNNSRASDTRGVWMASNVGVFTMLANSIKMQVKLSQLICYFVVTIGWEGVGGDLVARSVLCCTLRGREVRRSCCLLPSRFTLPPKFSHRYTVHDRGGTDFLGNVYLMAKTGGGLKFLFLKRPSFWPHS